MIRSQMISFRPQSIQQRNLTKYIQLIEQVFTMIKQISTQSFNVNSIASSIRQVVLKHDCLQQKNDILDFFFICQKSIHQNLLTNNEPSNKKSISKNNYWTTIIQNKISHLKAVQLLHQKIRIIQLKRGFNTLFRQQQKQQQTQPQIDIQSTNIQVQQDIKLKTLYFFKWCKFIQYGRSIKKLRLKQIDDLRKSLTFNIYGVKYSYFHNWRKQIKTNIMNRQKYNTIQTNNKRCMFRNSVDSFYRLFEIKKIQQKLVQKVKQSIIQCKKQQLFVKLRQNKKTQESKLVKEFKQYKNKSQQVDQQSNQKTNYQNNKKKRLNQIQIQKNKYRFIYYLIHKCQVQPVKNTTLQLNYKNSQLEYSKLCAYTAFNILKNQLYQIKLNISHIQSYRKHNLLLNSYQQYKQDQIFIQNDSKVNKFVKYNKLTKTIKNLQFYHQINHQIRLNNNQQQVNQQKQIMTSLKCIQQDQLWKQQKQNNNQTVQTIQDIKNTNKQQNNYYNQGLFKYVLHKNLTNELNQKLFNIKIQSFINKFTSLYQSNKLIYNKKQSIVLIRQSSIFNSLKLNHHLKLIKNKRNQQLRQIYDKNLLKNTFNSIKQYKHIRLSLQQTLGSIQQNIINKNQILNAFNKIQKYNIRLVACQNIFNKIAQISIKLIFNRCFSSYIKRLQKSKQLNKKSQLKNLSLLFNLLKKNQQYNLNKEQQIKINVIGKLNKVYFINQLKNKLQSSNKFNDLYFYNKQNKQSQFINTLIYRKQNILELQQKTLHFNKYLALSLFINKINSNLSQTQKIYQEKSALTTYLKHNQFDSFIKSFNTHQNHQLSHHNKTQLLNQFLTKNKLNSFIKKIKYQSNHIKQLIQSKIQSIYKSINFKSFFNKFLFQAKNNYLKRWTDWKQKSIIFQKLSNNQTHNHNIIKLNQTLKNYQLSYSFSVIKQNSLKQKLIIDSKSQQLLQFFNKKRKKSIKTVTSKIFSLSQASQCYHLLVKSLKLKYFSKYMRNSLILKYQKVKQYCSIKSYARNLKIKSLKGLRIMLMRLRDKQNRLKTEQQIIIKVDKALHQSRNTNKLSQTIQRFNSMSMKKSITIGNIAR